MPEPSPWTVVNGYTKTVVSVASAFLAFTATFYSNIGKGGPYWLLLGAWGLFVVAVAAALYSAARLTSHLRDEKIPPTEALLFSNIASFALFAGVVAFFAYALVAGWARDVNSESKRAVLVATTYASTFEPAFTKEARIAQVAWDAATERWVVTVVAATVIARVAVAPDGTVRDYQRQLPPPQPTSSAVLSDRVLFATNKALLTKDAYDTIAKVRAFAKDNPACLVLLSANADTTGPSDRNQILARQRAVAVRDALISAGGVAPHRVFIAELADEALPVVTPREMSEDRNRSVSIEVCR